MELYHGLTSAVPTDPVAFRLLECSWVRVDVYQLGQYDFYSLVEVSLRLGLAARLTNAWNRGFRQVSLAMSW
jgi:hypothetical protein